MEIGVAFIIGLLGSLLLTPFAIEVAAMMCILDKGDGVRKFQKKPVPAMGGIAVLGALIASGVYASLFSYSSNDLRQLGGMALSIMTMCVLGLFDDRIQFRARTKLLGQILIVLPTIHMVGPIETLVIFGQHLSLGLLAYPLTILWFLAIINAMNLIDGMDGLASGIGMISALGMAFVSATHFQSVPFVATIALAGTLCGFLLFNLPPAKIYLGDNGSMSIGLILATVSIRMSSEPGIFYVSPALLCLFLPLYDTMLAVVRRSLTSRPIGEGDNKHMHHRLQQSGYTVWQSLRILLSLHLLFVTLGCFSVLRHFEWVVWLTALFAIYRSARYKLIGHHEWRLGYVFVVMKLLPRFQKLCGIPPAQDIEEDGADRYAQGKGEEILPLQQAGYDGSNDESTRRRVA